MQAIDARPCGQAQIAQHKPLCCGGEIIRVLTGHRRTKGVDAGGLTRQSVTKRQAGRHIHVQFVLHIAFARPDFLRQITGEILILVLAERPPEIAFADRPHQIAVTDAAQFEIDLINIDAFNGQRGV